MLNVAECHYADCRYAQCPYAECRYAECLGAHVSAPLRVDFFVRIMIMMKEQSCAALAFKVISSDG